MWTEREATGNPSTEANAKEGIAVPSVILPGPGRDTGPNGPEPEDGKTQSHRSHPRRLTRSHSGLFAFLKPWKRTAAKCSPSSRLSRAPPRAATENWSKAPDSLRRGSPTCPAGPLRRGVVPTGCLAQGEHSQDGHRRAAWL